MAAKESVTAAGSIREEACQWVVRLDSGKLSAETEQAFREWVARSPRHKAEIKRLGALWDGLDELMEPQVDAAVSTVVSENVGRFWHRVWTTGAIAASIALVFIVFPLFDRGQSGPSTLYATQIGEHKTFTLADGSTVILNTDSQVEERFSDDQRLVRLVRGEAIFDVAHDKSRPFLVLAGVGAVRAVGTSFAVHLQREDIEVTVTEGRVELSTFASASPPTTGPSPRTQPTVLAQIGAGQQARFRETIGAITPIAAADIDRKLSWRKGILVFDAVTLEQVIKDVSRYSQLDFVIADGAIRSLKISGRFRTGDTAELLSVLETSFGIKVDHSTQGRVYLSKISG